MKFRAILAVAVFALSNPLYSQESTVPIYRDLLAPPSFFKDATTGKAVDPRKRLAEEGITFGKDESIAYDPVTSRVFVRASVTAIHRLQALLESEMAKGFALVALTYGILETSEPLLSGEPAETPSLVSTRVLTATDQVEALVLRAREARLGTVRPSSSLTTKSGETTEAWIGDTLTRNVPVISADASTVEMTLTLLQGPAGTDPQLVGETSLAILSGSSVALEEWLGENSWRTRIITAVVVDPAGVPIPRKKTTELPGENQKGLSASLFPGPVPKPALEKVTSIIIPSVTFQETPLLEAIQILKQASIEHDTSLPESRRGVNLLYSYYGGSGQEETPVTLRLSNVPLIEAIRYTADAAGCDYRIEGGTVLFGSFVSIAPSGAEDIWYAAFLRQEEADELESSGKKPEAAAKRQQAMKLYEALQQRQPDFHPKAVEEKVRALREMLQGE